MNTPKKVLILITKANWGGAQRYVYDVATHLPKDMFQVKVMAGTDGPLTQKLSAAGINAFGTLELGRDVNLKEDIRGFFKLFSLLRKDKPDILHVNSSKIGGLGALAGRLARVRKIVFTAHGWAFNEKRPFFERLFIAFLYWVTMISCHETIVVSEGARKQVRKWPFLEKKLTVIYNGLGKPTGFARSNARLELARMNPALKAAIDGVSEGNLVWIGTIAELHPIKGYIYALEAVERTVRSFETNKSTKRIIYTIISDGQQKAELEAKIAELRLEKNVIMMGFVPNAAEYVKAFDIFLLASLSEGLPYVLLEAGMAGVPVISTAVGGMPEIIDDMQTGILVQPKSSRELSHAISYAIEHPDERRQYGVKLSESVKKKFSLDHMIESTQEVYLRDGLEPATDGTVPGDLIAAIETRA